MWTGPPCRATASALLEPTVCAQPQSSGSAAHSAYAKLTILLCHRLRQVHAPSVLVWPAQRQQRALGCWHKRGGAALSQCYATVLRGFGGLSDALRPRVEQQSPCAGGLLGANGRERVGSPCVGGGAIADDHAGRGRGCTGGCRAGGRKGCALAPFFVACDERLGLLLTRLGCLQVTPGRRRCCSWRRTSLMLRAGAPALRVSCRPDLQLDFRRGAMSVAVVTGSLGLQV